MNILIGSHGVGKTSLLKELKILLPQLYVTDGVSRPVKLWFKERGGSDLFLEQSLINALTEWNWIQNLNDPIYTCTRSIIDSIIYSKCLGFNQLSQRSLDVFLKHIPQNINYFYLPIEFKLDDDGVRFSDLDFQQQVDREICQFITQYKLPVIKLTGDLKERVNLMYNHLNH